jgi:hypothetical protein
MASLQSRLSSLITAIGIDIKALQARTPDYFGDGSDGAFTANGVTAMPGATLSGSTYTLTRDVYFTDLTVNSGVTIDTHGYRIYCRGTLSGAGTISSNGLASTSRSAGTGGLNGSVSGGSVGGDGGLQNGAGTAAPAVGRGHGGIGGAGGAGTGFAGGAAPTSPLPPLGGIRRSLNELIDAVWWNTTAAAMQVIFGGGGGSGGGGSSAAAGGGGGGGGGVVIVAVRVLSGTLAFAAKGGAGGPALGTNAGGGGGGGGGAIHLLYGNKLGWSGTTDVSGGAGGAKNGTGVNGVAGSAGNVIQLAVVNDGPVQPTAWGPWTAIPFAANWGDFGSGEQNGQYRVSLDGKSVQVRGLVKITGASVTLAGANATIGTLPAGARPPAPFYYRVYVSASGTTGTMVTMGIAPSGALILYTELTGRSLTYGTGTYVGLDGIEFSTEA